MGVHKCIWSFQNARESKNQNSLVKNGKRNVSVLLPDQHQQK